MKAKQRKSVIFFSSKRKRFQEKGKNVKIIKNVFTFLFLNCKKKSYFHFLKNSMYYYSLHFVMSLFF